MKGLLHSNKFKKNLKKWLCMYIGALLILTSVVTYSKYISNLSMASDNAKVRRFDVDIYKSDNEGNICSIDNLSDKCKIGSYLPTEDMKFYFTVDISVVEVKTEIKLDIAIKEELKDNFKIAKIKNLTNNLDIGVKNGSKEEVKYFVNNAIDNKMIYEVTVKNKEGNVDGTLKGIFDILNISYVATQIK